MNMNEKRARVLRWAICLLLIAAMTMGSLVFAKYIRTVSGSDSIEVARVALNLNDTADYKALNLLEFPVSIRPGMAGTSGEKYRFVVTNAGTNDEGQEIISNVTQRYTIEIKTTGTLPLECTLECVDYDDGTPFSGQTAGTMLLDEPTSHTYELTVSWPVDKNQPEYQNTVDSVTVLIESEQLSWQG